MFMSIYEELCAAARTRIVRDNDFEAAAHSFPVRLCQALCAYLEMPEQQLQLRRRPAGAADEEPAWNWPELTALNFSDQDADGFFTFAVLIRLDLSDRAGNTIVMRPPTYFAPRFRFRPVPGGFDVVFLDRRGTDHPRFEIRNDEFAPLLDRLVEDCREALSFNPFEAVDRPRSIGFDISPAD
jgi:hypothetical protein